MTYATALPIRSNGRNATDTRTIILKPTQVGILDVGGITAKTSQTASKILQENHESHHVFNNDKGFHNHIPHLILSQYGLGAPSSVLQEAYARKAAHQRLQAPIQTNVLVDLIDPKTWDAYLGKEEHYGSFLEHYQRQMEANGWREVVHDTLFSGTKRAENMLIRLFSGLLHPFIHLGYGLEFELPAVIAEALAQASVEPVRDNSTAALLLAAENAAADPKDTHKTLATLLEEIHNDPKIRSATTWETIAIELSGLIENAGKEIISYVSQFSVPTDQLELKMAESINASAQISGGTIRADKQIKFDFFLLHCHTASIFLPVYCAQPFISVANKARLVTWKSRLDLALYAMMRAPALLLDEIRDYVPKDKTATNPWASVVGRVVPYADDGHSIKYVRAALSGEKVCRQFHDTPGFAIKGAMWANLAHMCVDSVEESEKDGGARWVYKAGFDEAWAGIGPRIRY